MDDTDDRDDTGGTGADRPVGRTDQLRMVAGEEAASRAGAARRVRRGRNLGAGSGPPDEESLDDDDERDELASLRGPLRRSAFDSIPDAPPSFLDDLVDDDDPTVLAPPPGPGPAAAPAGASARPAGTSARGEGTVGGADGAEEAPELFDTDVDVAAGDPTVAFSEDDLAADDPAAENLAGDDLAARRPSAERPSARRPPARRPSGERPPADDLAAGGPGGEPPAGLGPEEGQLEFAEDRPAVTGPAGGEAGDEPWADDPAPTAGRPASKAGAEVDPNRFGAVPVIRVGPVEADPDESIELPHWTEPPTGQVPRVLVDEERRDDDSWSTYGSAPRWRDPSSEWAASEYSDVTDLGDDLPRVGALDEGERPSLDEFFSFEDIDSGAGRGERAAGEPTTPPGRGRSTAETRPSGGSPTGEHPTGGSGTGRDLPVAVGAGVTLAALFVVLLRIGPAATLVLVTVAVAVAAAELMATTRRAGHHPAALVGLAAAAGLPLAVYWRGEPAYPLVLFLAVAFSLFWFLFGVDTERPAQNVGLTLLAVGYVGLFGSFAALMLRIPSPLGTNMLLAAAIPTVAADIGAFVVGRNAGRSPLTPISPSKTVEGALGGFAAAVTASVILNHFVLDLQPFDGLWDSAMLGVVIGIVSLLGDLCESLLKRSLGVKDMGTIIPGHGGVLDRMDALLFVLPATYYLALLLDLIPA